MADGAVQPHCNDRTAAQVAEDGLHRLAVGEVTRAHDLDKSGFMSEHVDPGRPVVLSELTGDWPARHWSLDHLKSVAGHREVPVYDSRPARDRQHQHAAAHTLRLSDYLTRLEHGEKDLRMFFYNLLAHAPELAADVRWPDMGLRLFRKLPVLFVGGRGARVQMHFDIDLADNLLCHFGGRKRVLLIPPEQTPLMYRVPYSFSSLFDVDFVNPDFERFPALAGLGGQLATLAHGDGLYIPSGWWHFVVYDDIGFSISLRAFPRRWADRARMLGNIIGVRNIDALGRRLLGERWNARNEAAAVTRTEQVWARMQPS